MNNKRNVLDLDEIDYDIVLSLGSDVRKPYAEVAHELNLDVRTVKRRAEAMSRKGYVTMGLTFIPEKIGFTSIANIILEIDPELYDTFVDQMMDYDCVYYMARGWGRSNLLIQANCPNNDELSHFIYDVLGHMPGVKTKDIFMITETLRDGTVWFPSKENLFK